MKVVFLAFDGPIIPRLSYPPSGKQASAWPSCVAALNRITDTTGAKIVVSSVWRADGLMQCRKNLRGLGVTGPVLGITPHLFDGQTQLRRGHEIQAWMDDYEREEIEAFVILDDDSDMEHLLPFLVKTPFETGLTEEHADAAIKLLTSSS